jgi:general secretion pathway protein G
LQFFGAFQIDSLLLDVVIPPARALARSRQNRSTARGFTLLELLVVMVIIGLMASFVAPRYFDQIGKSEIKATRARLDALDRALASYRLDIGHFPTSEQGLRSLVERPADEPKWSGPYLAKSLPSDPWGHAYVYHSPGSPGARLRTDVAR